MKKYFFLWLLLTLLLESCYTYSALDNKKEGKQAGANMQEQIKQNVVYKIDVDSKTYKIKAIKWEKDSLIAQTNIRKDIKKSFSAKQITNIRERKFSDTRSNVLTVLSYITIGTGVIFLVNKF